MEPEPEPKILPKGFVVNSDQIEGNIERIASEPVGVEDIAKIWKVYTTTKRRLLDPTAERLENYWWRIWGSRRRHLDGATVARLFANISDGQSFVPLRGPPNRDEGDTPVKKNILLAPESTTSTTPQRPNPRPIRNHTSSSSNLSRPPTVMPHPILKKTRGPSSNGPRPTARFVSPHESEHETEPASSSTSNAHVVVQPPSPLAPEDTKADKKSSATTRKKPTKPTFVATSATKKKRPVMPRRQSSQTSQVSQISNTSSATGSPASLQSPAQRTLTELGVARGKRAASSRFQENFSPTLRTPVAKPGSKAKSKSIERSTSSERSKSNERTKSNERSKSKEGKNVSPKKLVQEEPELEFEGIGPNELISVIPSISTSSSIIGQRLQEEAQSNGSKASQRSSPEKPSQPGLVRKLSGMGRREGSKSSASIAPTLTAVTTHGDSTQDVRSENMNPSTSAKDKGKGRAIGEYQPDIFAKRPVQTVASPSTSEYSASLARSKSQLTLLLEKDQKDRAKNAGHGSPNGKRRS
ncbi:hypothetical protein HYFRA_00001786 [Hymenoscyphus fraxineus]|uniref:Nitrogen regulatory protein areA GATA-like domain-containing protein n=1 Tax=Hymenoscyphus fraxineus TaxID=746836 RepID=A0A9N9PJJ0_9HELO|nr:hypothetical protein HYFRA_00001786 [Hymenoscyphus fraxineus]